ncbi:MAG: hypothetical protein JXB32_11880 [Deltaproteobacteria bacterium]|nr:hypothetical protein [Deltaproteobacteria bacterium]
MVKGWTALGTVLALALCGCSDSNSNGSCVPATCAAECQAAGYTVGSCVEGTCRCSGTTDAGADADADDDGAVREDSTATDEGGSGHYCAEASYIWISNTAEGTLSKVCTLDGIEVGRYWTSPQMGAGDPSRTSVNLHGDMVVTNRDPTSGPSSVTKFAAEPGGCVDRNGDHLIQTSTGPTDVRPWGEDECMIWNTPLGAGGAIGARATAWDGTEDPDTGAGGFVWIGALSNGIVYKLDGETGAVVDQTHVTNQPYGGAIDTRGNFWIVGAFCTIGICNLAKVNTADLSVEYVNVPCGYGISVDAHGRIWTSGRTLAGSCVNRHDPTTGTNQTYTDSRMAAFFRGIAVDDRGSVWVANTQGDVLQVDEESVELVHTITGLAPADVIGVAVDFQHQIWAVSQGGNMAVRINPETYAYEQFPIGSGPYTYSDMTGYQLRTVIEIF